jgi:hypothetical protein
MSSNASSIWTTKIAETGCDFRTVSLSKFKGVYFPMVKRPEPEPKHLPSPRAEGKNKCCYTSTRDSDWLRAGRSGDRIPVGGEIFRTRPDRPWGPPSLLYNGYRFFHVGEAAGVWRWPPTPSSDEVKERVWIYLYSPSGPSWLVLGWTWSLSFTFTHLLTCVISWRVQWQIHVLCEWWRWIRERLGWMRLEIMRQSTDDLFSHFGGHLLT